MDVCNAKRYTILFKKYGEDTISTLHSIYSLLDNKHVSSLDF